MPLGVHALLFETLDLEVRLERDHFSENQAHPPHPQVRFLSQLVVLQHFSFLATQVEYMYGPTGYVIHDIVRYNGCEYGLRTSRYSY